MAVESIHILLVEDDPESIRTVWNLLHEKSRFRYHLDAVTGLPQALERLAQQDTDVVLLDLSLLPQQDEMASIRSLRKMHPNVALLVITDLDNESAGLRALDAGAQDYLLKEELATRALVRALHYAVERQQGGALLRASDEQYRAAINSIVDYAIVSLNVQGRITGWSYGAEQVFGYLAAEIVGQPVALLFTLADRAAGVPERELVQARIQGFAEDERMHLRKDGRAFFASGMTRPIRDPSGLIQGYVKIARDTTERTRMAQALRESETKYRTLFNTMDEGYILTEVLFDDHEVPVDLQYLDANPAAIRMTGSELVGRTTRALDPRYEGHWFETFGRVAKTGVSERHELYAAPLRAWYDVSIVKIGDPDSARVAAIYRDVTERKRHEAAEREQRLLAEGLRDTAEALNSTLKLDQVLERVLVTSYRLLAHTATLVVLVEDSKLTNLCSDRLTAKELVSVERWHRQQTDLDATPLYRDAAESRQPVLVKNTRSTRPRLPAVLRNSMVIVPLVHENAGIGYLTFLLPEQHDFTEADIPKLQAFAFQVVGAINNARLFLQAQELAVLQVRQQLARDLHDAVSQTLFSASLIVQTLPQHWEQRPEMIPEILADLNTLAQGAMAEMRTLLLELRPMNVETTPFTQLVRQLVTAAQGRTRAVISLEFEGEPILPPEVQLVLYRITQEALNNIKKHAHATQVWIVGRGGAGYAELHIRDDGQGFQRNTSSSGLGLQIMRERAEEVNAWLEIQSSPGKGTEVYVLWPRPDPSESHPRV